jgi:hypothetical protein
VVVEESVVVDVVVDERAEVGLVDEVVGEVVNERVLVDNVVLVDRPVLEAEDERDTLEEVVDEREDVMVLVVLDALEELARELVVLLEAETEVELAVEVAFRLDEVLKLVLEDVDRDDELFISVLVDALLAVEDVVFDTALEDDRDVVLVVVAEDVPVDDVVFEAEREEVLVAVVVDVVVDVVDTPGVLVVAVELPVNDDEADVLPEYRDVDDAELLDIRSVVVAIVVVMLLDTEEEATDEVVELNPVVSVDVVVLVSVDDTRLEVVVVVAEVVVVAF